MREGVGAGGGECYGATGSLGDECPSRVEVCEEGGLAVAAFCAEGFLFGL